MSRPYGWMMKDNALSPLLIRKEPVTCGYAPRQVHSVKHGDACAIRGGGGGATLYHGMEPKYLGSDWCKNLNNRDIDSSDTVINMLSVSCASLISSLYSFV